MKICEDCQHRVLRKIKKTIPGDRGAASNGRARTKTVVNWESYCEVYDEWMKELPIRKPRKRTCKAYEKV